MRVISGSLGGRVIRTVDGPGYRPATAKVRGALFSMLESRDVVWGGVRVLDLFAGSGSLGFEALSRGAQEVCFVEKEPRAVVALQRNAEAFGLEAPQCRVVSDDVARFVRGRAYAPFDVIFIDPPYGENRLAPTVKAVMKGGWLAPEGFLLAEVETRLRLEPETTDEELELILDRTYGQTRIVLWQHSSNA